MAVMAAIPLMMAAASAVATTVATVASTKAQQAQANYQRKVAENNAILARRQAADALARGNANELTQRLQTQNLAGYQRAALAANGVDVNAGSSLDIFADTFGAGEYDALNIRGNAQREALGYETQGMNYENQAIAQKWTSNQLSAALPWAVGSTLLTGASDVASKWYGFQQAGGFGTADTSMKGPGQYGGGLTPMKSTVTPGNSYARGPV